MGKSGGWEWGNIWLEMLREWMGPGMTTVVLETAQKPATWPHCSLWPSSPALLSASSFPALDLSAPPLGSPPFQSGSGPFFLFHFLFLLPLYLRRLWQQAPSPPVSCSSPLLPCCLLSEMSFLNVHTPHPGSHPEAFPSRLPQAVSKSLSRHLVWNLIPGFNFVRPLLSQPLSFLPLQESEISVRRICLTPRVCDSWLLDVELMFWLPNLVVYVWILVLEALTAVCCLWTGYGAPGGGLV